MWNGFGLEKRGSLATADDHEHRKDEVNGCKPLCYDSDFEVKRVHVIGARPIRPERGILRKDFR
jgi:hypothetical protein